jgi:coproporphyrinogen III oxidase
MSLPCSHRELILPFLKNLRQEMILAFEKFEPQARFVRKEWKHQEEGGGEMAVLRGEVFEKAAINWSGVHGKKFPMADGEGAFFATGVSLITHMANPHLPTAHFNIRFIETEKRWWFGGGYDLTPMGYPYQEDTNHFHQTASQALDLFGPEIYNTFSKNAKEYFYIPHYQKERGVGGLFFDHWNTGDFEKDYTLWQSVGNSFLHALLPIYSKRLAQSYTEEERELQLQMRAHYVEFNLLYDRGTRFGFQSGGNPEAILCSMPPLVKW